MDNCGMGYSDTLSKYKLDVSRIVIDLIIFTNVFICRDRREPLSS
jgi:hypothetical protein